MWGRIFQTERKGWTKAFKERGPFKALKEGQNAEDGQRGGGGPDAVNPDSPLDVILSKVH